MTLGVNRLLGARDLERDFSVHCVRKALIFSWRSSGAFDMPHVCLMKKEVLTLYCICLHKMDYSYNNLEYISLFSPMILPGKWRGIL